MGWNAIGWYVAAFLGAAGTAVTFLYPTHRESGYILLAVAMLCLFAAVLGTINLIRPKINVLRTRLGTAKIMLLVGIFGTWLFLTLALGLVAWMVVYPQPGQIIGGPIQAAADEGPISWIYNFSMEGGMGGMNVASLRFRGANTSKKAVELRQAELISLIDGTRLPLDIVASDAAGDTKVVSIDKVQLIPPGATIELVGKFGPPDPNVEGHVLGMEPKAFLDKWRQFSFNAADDTKSYHFDFNENAMMPFFQGKVGPRVVLKP
jgi:hypothetical protein